MSQNNEFDNLAQSLSRIVTKLSEYVSQKNNTLVQKQPIRIKKTPEMTYHEFLRKALSTKKPVQITAKKQSYSLQEDLELLLELSGYEAITSRCFEEIVAKDNIKRSFDSMKSRYLEHLSKIGEPEMKKIVTWIERQGVEGYLYFQQSQLKITLVDPKEEKRTQKLDDKKIEERRQEKKRQRAPSLEDSEKKVEKKKEAIIPTNCKELNDVLKIYSKMVNLPIKTLLERLDQVSGDFIQLDNFIQSKDSKLLWSSQEDEILRKGGPELQLLNRYRGAAVVQRRKQYLGLR